MYRSRARMSQFLHFHRNRASEVVEWDWENMPIDWRTEWLGVDGTRVRDIRVLLSRKSESVTSVLHHRTNTCARTDLYSHAYQSCKWQP